jgi:hypothetical protein
MVSDSTIFDKCRNERFALIPLYIGGLIFYLRDLTFFTVPCFGRSLHYFTLYVIARISSEIAELPTNLRGLVQIFRQI